jgi:DNA polymerase III gamma/tau subunit
VIDPISIGIAFATAQTVVANIKKAVALGKDVKSLYKEFSTFYESADAIHTANNKARVHNIGKSDEQINKEALDLAWQSKQLWEAEKELKSMLFMTGNKSVWEEMMAHRARMHKEKADMEKAIADKKQKDKEALGELFMNIFLFIGGIAAIIPIGALIWHMVFTRGV